MLAFAYASVFALLAGNVTQNPDIRLTGPNQMTYEYFDLEFRRVGSLIDFPVEVRNNMLQIPNNSMRLRFVSCGLKGTEGFNLLAFVSVFEKNVWKWIIITITVFVFGIVYITGRTWRLF